MNPTEPDLCNKAARTENSQLIVNFSGARADGDHTITIGSEDEAFPGSYDDGFLLPAGWDVNIEIETKIATLAVGQEWKLSDPWRVSAGLMAGSASQDMKATTFNNGAAWRNLTTNSKNKMYGVFGGVSHYTAISDVLGLRISGTLGIMHNKYDYSYVNARSGGGTDQANNGSSSGLAISTQLAARLERQLSKRGMLTVEVGYEGMSGIGNGADTFLNPAGTATTAKIEDGSIGAGYLSVGYAFSF